MKFTHKNNLSLPFTQRHYFATMIRRRFNKIEGLKDEEGVWKSDKGSLKDIAINYVQNLFSNQHITASYANLPQMFPRLEGVVLASLNKEVSDEEVRNGLFGIGGLKTPGPDGFPALFFQNQWDVCKKDVVCLVSDSFNSGTFPVDIN